MFLQKNAKVTLAFFLIIFAILIITLIPLYLILPNFVKTADSFYYKIAKKLDAAVLSSSYEVPVSLSQSSTLKRAVSPTVEVSDGEVMAVLETAKEIYQASLVYLLDTTGTVINSTPLETGESIIGANYSFRPYFINSMSGSTTIYPALGTFTGVRGIYLSAPVYDTSGEIGGIIVVKISLKRINEILFSTNVPIFLVSPNGVIFASNREEYLYHYIEPMTEDELREIEESKQFADQELKPFLELYNKNTVHLEGKKYFVNTQPFLSSKWTVITLYTHSSIYSIDYRYFFMIIGILTLLVIVIAYLLKIMYERTRIAEDLQKSQNLYESLFSLAPEPITITSLNGSLLSFNDSFLKTFKYSREEVAKINARELYVDFHTDRTLLLHRLHEKGTLSNYFLLMKDSKGNHIHTSNSLSLIDYNGTIAIEAMIRDITELERKDEQLRRAQKNEMIGIMTSGLAHDLNNIMAGINGAMSLLKYKAASPETNVRSDLGDCFDMIDSSIKRGTEMIRQLSSLAHQKEAALDMHDLSTIITETILLCRNTFDNSVKIEQILPEEPAMCLCDPVRMQQVLLNLFINASHAMTIMRSDKSQYGGTLNISLEKASFKDPIYQKHFDAQGEALWRINVTDNGVGIEKEEISQIFKPFYTTKDSKKGSGLGLSMVNSIVTSHRGYVLLESQPGVGTSVSVYLPHNRSEEE